MKITITEVNGWSKTVVVEKNIACIGSAPDNDVILSSTGIAPSHLQVLSSPLLPSSARLVNLDNPVEVFSRGNETSLLPFHTCDIYDGDEIQLGGYRLAFSLPLSAGVLHSSGSIEARLVFASAVLHPDQPLDGRLTIRNTGSQNNCQVRVAIKGFPSSCYQVDPIPLLYSSAQEEIHLRLFHHQITPDAGLHDFILTVTAPESYPGEEFVIHQGIFVMPVYQQTIQLVDDLTRPEPQPAPVMLEAEMKAYNAASIGGLPVSPDEPASLASHPIDQTTAIAETPEPYFELEDDAPPAVALPQPEPEPAMPAAPPVTAPVVKPRTAPPQDRSKLKVIQDQADDFWEGK